MSGAVVIPTREDSTGGAWRNPAVSATVTYGDDNERLRRRRHYPSSISPHNPLTKIHNKFFRITRRLLHSDSPSATGSTLSTFSSGPLDHVEPAQPKEVVAAAPTSGASSQGEDLTALPIYTSFPHGLKNFRKLGSYDRARAEAVSLTYANPQIESTRFLRRLPSGVFFLNEPSRPIKLTVILDMDETLVHTVADHTSCVMKGDGRKIIQHAESSRVDTRQTMTVFYRPFVVSALQALRKMRCEIILFTTGTQGYTDAILDTLDPAHELIDHRLYRQHASGHPSKSNVLCKNLELLGRELSRCLLIDDISDSYCLQPANGWPIAPYGKKLKISDIGSILSYGSVEDFRRFCPPAILERRGGGHPLGLASGKLVVGCGRKDYALLNAVCLIRQLLKSGMSVPAFTIYYERQIRTALLNKSDGLYCP